MRNERKAPLVAIVDDEAAVREATDSLMRSAGFAVECFASASAFLRSGCAARARCVILDVHLPRMSGLELQRVLANNGQHIPVVFVTAQEDTAGHLQAQALRAGALDFLHKPFDDEALLNAVRRALDQRAD
jgi:FixJ family two-component response regulator